MIRSLSEKASDIYDTIIFDSDRFYNEPAPDEWVSFFIAGILAVVTLIFYAIRVHRIRRGIKNQTALEFKGSIRLRALIGALVDVDDPAFTCFKFAAQSFFFLGAIQINYEVGFIAMIACFTFESCFDTIRILIAFREVNSLDEFMPVSKKIGHKARNKTQLQPTNVYEDLTRGKAIVLMVFVTQCLLIAFVVADVYQSPLHSCHDGTSGCPVAGTQGSWWFYVLGIFMASVFLLGPKTSFGQSEQNPAFWLKLLVMAKQKVIVSWYDPVADQILQFKLRKSDWRIWVRFLMSFCINGVSFHILVHTLPIQVAAQSSLTGVVFRAVGMMYLVDLDDVPGYKMTLVEDTEEMNEPETSLAGDSVIIADSLRVGSVRPTPGQGLGPVDEGQEMDFESTRTNLLDEYEITILAQRIIDDAKDKLDALLEGKMSGNLTVTGALALASGLGSGGAGISKQSKADFPTNMQDGDMEFQSERTQVQEAGPHHVGDNHQTIDDAGPQDVDGDQ